MTRSEILQVAKPILFNTSMTQAILDGRKTETRRVIKPACPGGEILSETPPYKPGDYLYIRETWSPMYPDEKSNDVVGYMYRADDGMDVSEYDRRHPNGNDYQWPGIWKPSIHMPKEAARIFLQVTGVRAERLQEITINGMLAEGVIPENVTGGQWQQWQNDYMSPVWDSTIPSKDRDKYGWAANPWVWVVEFERVEVTE